jgi:hypothetical protein
MQSQKPVEPSPITIPSRPCKATCTSNHAQPHPPTPIISDLSTNTQVFVSHVSSLIEKQKTQRNGNRIKPNSKHV